MIINIDVLNAYHKNWKVPQTKQWPKQYLKQWLVLQIYFESACVGKSFPRNKKEYNVSEILEHETQMLYVHILILYGNLPGLYNT